MQIFSNLEPIKIRISEFLFTNPAECCIPWLSVTTKEVASIAVVCTSYLGGQLGGAAGVRRHLVAVDADRTHVCHGHCLPLGALLLVLLRHSYHPDGRTDETGGGRRG